MYELMNFRELIEMLDNDERYKHQDYFIVKTRDKDESRCIWNTPVPLRDTYKCIGCATVWNEFGGIDDEFKMYKPVNNGTILYEKI